MAKKWEKYEQVAQILLDRFAHEFGLSGFEPKQVIEGKIESYEIDAKGVKEGDQVIILVECKHYKSSRITKKDVAYLSFQIDDTGAAGGITVSTLPVQRGAAKISNAKNIVNVTLNKECTTVDYIMKFLRKILVGFSDEGFGVDSVQVTRYDKDGKLITYDE